jgi:hypothetical protein
MNLTLKRIDSPRHNMDSESGVATLVNAAGSNFTSEVLIVQGFHPSILISGTFAANVEVYVVHQKPDGSLVTFKKATKTVPDEMGAADLGAPIYGIQIIISGWASGTVTVTAYAERRRG